jgi:hypothetical protein
MEKNIVYKNETIKTELMTPEKAKRLLKHNNNNRRVNRKNVNKYKKAIMDGKFIPTGDCITVDKYGNLLDGQHRLIAISETGVDVRVDIKYGVNPDVKYIQNTGRATTQTDKGDIFLAPLGIHSKMYPIISRTIGFFEHDGNFSKSKMEYHPEKIIQFATNEKHNDIVKKVGEHAKKNSNPFGNASFALTKEVILSLIDRSKAEAFFNAFYTHDCAKGSPVRALWMWIEKRNEKNKNARWGACGEEELDVAINIAWNAFIQNKELNKINVHKDGELRKVEALDINNNLQEYFQN